MRTIGHYTLILVLVMLAALGGFMIGTLLSTAFYGLVPAPAEAETLGAVTVWLAVGLFGNDEGERLDTSPVFENRDDCAQAVEFARIQPFTKAISACYEITLLPVKTHVDGGK